MKLRIVGITALTTLLAGCGGHMHDGDDMTWQFREYSSLGEQIYFTGRGEDGRQIPFSGGHHHMRMHGGGCVTCHGADREGGQVMWPRFWVRAPALTPEALGLAGAGDHEDAHDGGNHEHEAYTAETLKRAIIEGVEPDGRRLDDAMPRWQLKPAEADALVAYLMSE